MSPQKFQHYRESEASCGESAAFYRSDGDPGWAGAPGGRPRAPRPGPGIAEGNFISKSYQKALKNYQMKARAVPPPCRGFKKLKNTRVWTGPPRKRQHYRGFRHGPRQMPRGSATFFFEVLGLRAVGLSFVASADIYVVFWGSFFEIPNTIEKLKPRIAESTYCVGGLAVPSS